MTAEHPEGWTPRDEWEPFVYQAQVESVVDGDTLDCRLDLGFHTTLARDVRLRGVDTREIHFVSHDSEEYKRGMEHKRYTQRWVARAQEQWDGDWPFIFKTELEQTGKYGRVLARVFARSEEIDDPLGVCLLREFDDVEVYEG